MSRSSASMRVGRPGQRHAELLALLAGHVAPGDDARLLLDVLRADLDAHRHAAQLVLGEAEAGRACRSRVDLHRRSARSRRSRRAAGPAARRPASRPRRCTAPRSASFLPSGQMTTCDRGQPRRHDQAVVVGVRHDQAADEPRARRPSSSPRRTRACPPRSGTSRRTPWRSSGPRKWLVPACSALPSCIIASMQSV